VEVRKAAVIEVHRDHDPVEATDRRHTTILPRVPARTPPAGGRRDSRFVGIDRSAAPNIVAKGGPDPVPALLLGRLAVDRHHANLGVGTALATHVLATAVELNEKAACRAVGVTALSQAARIWWERLGFHPFDPEQPDELDRYLLTSEIEATLRRAR
jgi:GNAT superfamily N-acetyltransferase